ncbi:hypothetical protein ING2E5A_0683 [Petrimonas mucosa]|uniref:Uncharacterized protein n=1 Tax=Petrimonas mucosa TaxID=1642646 RepID=A0A1G4G4U6_9BACT|nr:hypothetical protein ING2E5A_0683 [Petrimonas mucosa]
MTNIQFYFVTWPIFRNNRPEFNSCFCISNSTYVNNIHNLANRIVFLLHLQESNDPIASFNVIDMDHKKRQNKTSYLIY